MSKLPISLKLLLGRSRAKQFPRGQILMYVGDQQRDVYVLKEGVIKLYDIDDEGNEKVLHLVAAPAVIPFVFFSGNGLPIRWYYAALTDTEVLVVDPDQLRNLMREEGEVALYLMHQFSEDVHELLVRLSSLGKSSARQKILAALRYLLMRHASHTRGKWWRVNFDIQQQFLADLVGITRESCSSIMKDLQSDGIVHYPKLSVLELHKERLLNSNLLRG